MRPVFKSHGSKLEIIDQIERCRYQIGTSASVTPKPVQQSQIQYPVGAVAEITTDVLHLPINNTVYIRDTEKSMITEVKPSEQISLPRDEYTLDLSGSLKVYTYVESPIRIYSDANRTHIEFGRESRVIIGARSYHTRPAGSITLPPNPTDVMRAVSLFGSALKTTAPERSYPTLRGHPPVIEIGNELSIPSNFERPNTGIRIEVPPTLEHVFVIAPLVYYLGAKLVPGPEPRLFTENGFDYMFDQGNKFETSVKRVLNHVFFLDCLVRTEELSPTPLHERQIIEPFLEFDISTVYDRSLAEQLEIYLSDVPFSIVNSQCPKWQYKTRISPTAEAIEFLPFIVNDLATVSIQEEELTPSQSQTQTVEGFALPDIDNTDETACGSNSAPVPTIRSAIPVAQQVLDHNGTTEVIATTSPSAFYNNIGRKPKNGPIEIEVVCNDPDMREELVTVYSTYRNQADLPFDITIHHDLETNELKNVLERESDFIHYIGHIDRNGFRCSDGQLDATSIESTGTEAFFLNACQSYEQGFALVEAGSVGGIVTLDDVQNSDAVNVGGRIARLLNRGYSLYAAVNIARIGSNSGDYYHIVGNKTTTIAQSDSASNICSITRDGDQINLEMTTYASGGRWKGSVVTPYLESVDSYYLLPKKLGPFSVTKPQLVQFLEQETIPVLIDGTFRWSDEIGIKEIRSI